MGEATETVSVSTVFQTEGVANSKNRIRQFFSEVYKGTARAGKSMLRYGSTQDSTRKKTDSLLSSTKRLIAGFLAYKGVSIVKDIGRTAIEFEKLDLKMKAVFTTQGRIRSEMEFTSRVAKRFGLEVLSVSDGYAKLAAASRGTVLEGRKTRNVFESIAGASASLGLSGENLRGVLNAVEQMMSKGTVTSEELKQQLGDRLPGAIQIAARALNVTTVELQKMLENGEVLAEDFLPKFGAQLRKEFSGGAKHAKTLQGRVNLFFNAWKKMQAGVVSSGFGEAVGRIFEKSATFIEQNQAKIKVFAGFIAKQIPTIIRFGTVLLAVFAAKKIASLSVSIVQSIVSIGSKLNIFKIGTGLVLAGVVALAAYRAEIKLTESAIRQIGLDGYGKSLEKISKLYADAADNAKNFRDLELAASKRVSLVTESSNIATSAIKGDLDAKIKQIKDDAKAASLVEKAIGLFGPSTNEKIAAARVEASNQISKVEKRKALEIADIKRQNAEDSISLQNRFNKKVIGDTNSQTSAIKKQLETLRRKNKISLLGVDDVAEKESSLFLKRNKEALDLGKISRKQFLQNKSDLFLREKVTKALLEQKKIAKEIAEREKKKKKAIEDAKRARKKAIEDAKRDELKRQKQLLQSRKDQIRQRQQLISQRLEVVDKRRDRLDNIGDRSLTAAVQVDSVEGERQRLLAERNKAITPEVKAIDDMRSDLVDELDRLKKETEKTNKILRDLRG